MLRSHVHVCFCCVYLSKAVFLLVHPRASRQKKRMLFLHPSFASCCCAWFALCLPKPFFCDCLNIACFRLFVNCNLYLNTFHNVSQEDCVWKSKKLLKYNFTYVYIYVCMYSYIYTYIHIFLKFILMFRYFVCIHVHTHTHILCNSHLTNVF